MFDWRTSFSSKTKPKGRHTNNVQLRRMNGLRWSRAQGRREDTNVSSKLSMGSRFRPHRLREYVHMHAWPQIIYATTFSLHLHSFFFLSETTSTKINLVTTDFVHTRVYAYATLFYNEKATAYILPGKLLHHLQSLFVSQHICVSFLCRTEECSLLASPLWVEVQLPRQKAMKQKLTWATKEHLHLFYSVSVIG